MPRNIITPYECRRHEVRGCKPQPTPASERRESHKIPSFRRLHEGDDDTPHFATRYARRLVRGYSFSLLAELRPVLRTPYVCLYVYKTSHAGLMSLMSFCLIKNPRRAVGTLFYSVRVFPRWVFSDAMKLRPYVRAMHEVLPLFSLPCNMNIAPTECSEGAMCVIKVFSSLQHHLGGCTTVEADYIYSRRECCYIYC